MINDLKKGIEVSKNLLDTLPKNNIKNKNKYQSVLIETKNTYDEILKKIENQINNRYDKYISIEEDKSLSDQLDRINFIKENIYLLNNYNSPYEKFNLDKILYQLNHFYNADLSEANKNIIRCIKIFERVGIKLTPEDFNYSEYAYEYMKVLLNNFDDIDMIKESFEKIYWQCSDLLIHIELNIKYLYNLNKNAFEKYANTEKDKFLKLFSNDPLTYYQELVANYEMDKNNSLKRGMNKFINKEWNINDYQQSKIDKIYSFFTDNINEDSDGEINKLSASALEYKNYLYFSYIIEDLKQKYKEKNNQTSSLKNIMKAISKNEKLIHKYNKKKKKKEKINITIMNLINELENLYDQLDEATFYDRLYKNITDNSSIYDALAIACSHYSYIVKCMKENEKTENFELEQQKLTAFLLNPYNNIIMNIAILEEKDLALVISDRYKLSNFNITKDNFQDESSIDEIINNAEKIKIYNNVVKKLSYDNLKFIDQVKELFKK